MPENMNITPSPNAYTPSMAKFKKLLEDLLNNSIDVNISDKEFRTAVEADIQTIQGLMATILMQDILYKAGVEYRDSSRYQTI